MGPIFTFFSSCGSIFPPFPSLIICFTGWDVLFTLTSYVLTLQYKIRREELTATARVGFVELVIVLVRQTVHLWPFIGCSHPSRSNQSV